MYYIEVVMYGGKKFKYIADTERDAKFFKKLADNCGYAIMQLSIINLYNRKENNED